MHIRHFNRKYWLLYTSLCIFMFGCSTTSKTIGKTSKQVELDECAINSEYQDIEDIADERYHNDVSKINNIDLLLKISKEDPDESVRLKAADRLAIYSEIRLYCLSTPIICEIIPNYTDISKSHRTDIKIKDRRVVISDLLPIFRLLSDPEVVMNIGKIANISIQRDTEDIGFWQHKPEAGLVFVTAERYTCNIMFSKNDQKGHQLYCGYTWGKQFVGGISIKLPENYYSEANIDPVGIILSKVIWRLPQSLLSKIAVENEEWSIRQEAVKVLTDQVILAKIATDDKSTAVREAAIKRLTDQNMLAKISMMENEDHAVRYAAISKLTDKNLLAKIAVTNEENCTVRMEAVSKLIDQDLLAKIAMEDEHISVRKKAIDKLNDNTLAQMGIWVKPELTKKVTDQELLYKLATEAKNCDVTKAAINNINNQNLLAKIVLENKTTYTRMKALKKLTDQTVLARIAIEDKDSFIRQAAIENLIDQTVLAQIALEDEEKNVRKCTIAKLTDQNILARIASEDKDIDNRIKAIEKLTDQTILARIAAENEDWDTREASKSKLTDQTKSQIGIWLQWELTEKVTDQELLANIAVKAGNRNIRAVAVKKVTDQTLLAKIAKEDKDSYVREFAEEQLERLRNQMK